MDLYFLRHGKAVDAGSDGVHDDFSRSLTEKGMAEMEVEAAAFERFGLCPDVILTSPLVRAKQTAQIVAKRLGLKKALHETDLLALGCDLERLRRLLDEHRSCTAVMLVGHEPDFSSIIGELIGGSSTRVEMKKGSLAHVSIEGPVRRGAGELHWLLTPKILLAASA